MLGGSTQVLVAVNSGDHRHGKPGLTCARFSFKLSYCEPVHAMDGMTHFKEGVSWGIGNRLY